MRAEMEAQELSTWGATCLVCREGVGFMSFPVFSRVVCGFRKEVYLPEWLLALT
eukprot:CAMPEP_0202845912 /NCGR_PEP_ID=MMETSP1389-20130828/71234_1 /ASSEMBLY_ACC=CAM_ASM_000865 /TAXON_ID=302021 /ORGANISM="Rhodomonas sp., Strain CCMP768" /LENGTH=53 /DNA_ID=CAMNT_0049523411 /DNA_START=76 /DNA_END=233 /DNA_ORIENTATION=+